MKFLKEYFMNVDEFGVDKEGDYYRTYLEMDDGSEELIDAYFHYERPERNVGYQGDFHIENTYKLDDKENREMIELSNGEEKRLEDKIYKAIPQRIK